MIQKICDLIYKYVFFFLPAGNPYDYIAHFIVSFSGVIIFFLILKLPGTNLGFNFKISFLVAALAMLLLGVTKEILDARAGKTDMVFDLSANALGIIAAMIIIKALWH